MTTVPDSLEEEAVIQQEINSLTPHQIQQMMNNGTHQQPHLQHCSEKYSTIPPHQHQNHPVEKERESALQTLKRKAQQNKAQAARNQWLQNNKKLKEECSTSQITPQKSLQDTQPQPSVNQAKKMTVCPSVPCAMTYSPSQVASKDSVCCPPLASGSSIQMTVQAAPALEDTVRRPCKI